MRELAGMDHVGPGGEVRRVGRSSLDRWVRAYRSGGFDALVPAPRVRVARSSAEALELAVALKVEAPGRSAVGVATILAESGRGDVSARTIQ
ncbi:MAG: helix-turn-helix domain-containing protein, partial [Gemmatimonadales bacterium]